MYNSHDYPPAFQQSFQAFGQYMQQTMLNPIFPPPFFSSDLSNRRPIPSNVLTARYPEEFDEDSDSTISDEEDDTYTEVASDASRSPSSLMKWSPPGQTSLTRSPRRKNESATSRQMQMLRTPPSAPSTFNSMNMSFSHPQPSGSSEIHTEMTSARIGCSGQSSSFMYSSVTMSGGSGGQTAMSQQCQSMMFGAAAAFFSSGPTGGFGGEDLMVRTQISSGNGRRYRRERR